MPSIIVTVSGLGDALGTLLQGLPVFPLSGVIVTNPGGVPGGTFVVQVDSPNLTEATANALKSGLSLLAPFRSGATYRFEYRSTYG